MSTDLATELARIAACLQQPRLRIVRDVYDKNPDGTWLVTQIYRGSVEVHHPGNNNNK